MTKIQLAAKGLAREIWIDMVEQDKGQSFETNVKLREYQVKANINQLVKLYSRELNGIEYKVAVVFQSKMNELQ